MVLYGFKDDEAKEDLCRAVADHKIQVRVTLGNPRRLFSDRSVRPPVHLEPADIDWQHSRPNAPWWIVPMPGEHYFWDSKREKVELVEVSTGEVIELFCPLAASVEQGGPAAEPDVGTRAPSYAHS